MNNPDFHSDELNPDEVYEKSGYNFPPSFINVWSLIMNVAELQRLSTHEEEDASQIQENGTRDLIHKVLCVPMNHYKEQARILEGEVDHYSEIQPNPEAIAMYDAIIDQYNAALRKDELTPDLAQQFADKMVTLIYGKNPYNHKSPPGDVSS